MKRPESIVYIRALIYWIVSRTHNEGWQVEVTVGQIADYFNIAPSTVIVWIKRHSDNPDVIIMRKQFDGRGIYRISAHDISDNQNKWVDCKRAHHEVWAYQLDRMFWEHKS